MKSIQFRWVAVTVAASIALGVGATLVAAETAASRQFATLLDDAWEFDLKDDPLGATDVGDHRYDNLLPTISLADSKQRIEVKKEFVKRLEAIDRDQLSAADQVNYDIFGRGLRNDVRQFDFQTYLMPVSDRWGFHIEFPELPRNLKFETDKDYENYIARLRGFDAYAAGYMELMREGVRQGVTVPAVIMQRYNEPIQAQIVDDPEASLMFEPFKKFPDNVAAADQERLRTAGRAAIAEVIVPTYRRFQKFMRDEYVPNCRATIAASALPDGREFYRFCVHKFTTVDDLTPEAVHEIGQREVKRIRGEMDEIIKRVKFEGDFAAFTEYLRTDPKFYAKTPEALQKEASFILKRMDGQLPKLFGHLPRMPYGIREIPAYIAPQATFAYYQSPAGDGTRAGFFYLNTSELPSRPMYMLESLCSHEAVPGHHLQLALQQELTDLPKFRRYGGFTAFVEGWGLYAEGLGKEVGFYNDPYQDFGRLTMEAWRACRLVVDTGMHYMGWTREQAIDFMRDNTAMPLHDIRAEVDRYIGWPGQALAYKIGQLKIRSLRDEAEQRLGDRFDVRAFHDVVLGGGSVPLSVLEANVHKWIDGQLEESGKSDGSTKQSDKAN